MARQGVRLWPGGSWVKGGVVAALAMTVGLAAGCAGTPGPGGQGATAQPSPGASAASTVPTSAQEPAPDVVTIVATEWSYTITGSPHAGLVELHFSNVGKYSHELGLVRVKDGVTLGQVKAALRKSEKAARALMVDPDTEITSAGIAGPQVNQHVVVQLAAGHYVVTSFLPLDGASQVERGMIGEFTVGAAAASAPVPPQTSGTVKLLDDAIAVPDGFAHGGTFQVTNTGTKPHDFSVARLSGSSLPDFFQCVAKSFGAGTSIDDCPGSLQGGVTALQPGASAYLTVVFGSGDFGYVSTQGEGADFAAGLNGTFTNP